MIEKFKKWYRGLPDKKRYIELISALLTIPVLLTVLLLNWDNLKGEKKEEPTPQVKETVKIVTIGQKETSPIPTVGEQCKKEVGPVEISSPKEGETVTSNPVCFNITYEDENYCSVVWSYRIDNGSWSDFTDKSVCLYNLSSGEHKFELKVKSVVSNDQVELVRNFTYDGKESEVTPTPSQ